MVNKGLRGSKRRKTFKSYNVEKGAKWTNGCMQKVIKKKSSVVERAVS